MWTVKKPWAPVHGTCRYSVRVHKQKKAHSISWYLGPISVTGNHIWTCAIDELNKDKYTKVTKSIRLYRDRAVWRR